MPQPSPRWQAWRVTLTRRPTPATTTPDPLAHRMALPRYPHRPAAPTSDPLAELRALPAGPDGVRRELVARVRELIAAGEYDTPDRWHQAQERMFNELLDG
ncbi:MAG: hypothetical protein U0871_21520 [Gemmataceae bacterium]